MSKQYCAKHVFHYSPNHIINVICPRREIDRLKAELEEYKKSCIPLSDESKDQFIHALLNAAALKEQSLERQFAEARASAKAWLENCHLMERELEKERNKHADTIGKLAERNGAIACYNEVLAELREENTALREEVGRLKQNIVDTLTERLSDVDTARKQVALGRLTLLLNNLWRHTMESTTVKSEPYIRDVKTCCLAQCEECAKSSIPDAPD